MKHFLYKLESFLDTQFWFLHPDIHERQRFIASKIPTGRSILDVGGEQRVLEQIGKAREYYTINIDSKKTGIHTHHQRSSKDLVYDGKHIPFPAKHFDVLVCIDVLEHVPKNNRHDLIVEMLRVTKETLIISAPYGSEAHIETEKQLAEDLHKKKHDVTFLKEHIKIGLPSPEEVTTWKKDFKGKAEYSGNSRWAMFNLYVQLLESKIPALIHLLFFLKRIYYFLCNLLVYPFLFSKKPNSLTNRFYIEINQKA